MFWLSHEMCPCFISIFYNLFFVPSVILALTLVRETGSNENSIVSNTEKNTESQMGHTEHNSVLLNMGQLYAILDRWQPYA